VFKSSLIGFTLALQSIAYRGLTDGLRNRVIVKHPCYWNTSDKSDGV
jgi:hypothetical protein